MEVAASNTSPRLHCSSLGFVRGSSVGSSGSGSGSGAGCVGFAVGCGLRLPKRWMDYVILTKRYTFRPILTFIYAWALSLCLKSVCHQSVNQ